MGAQPRAPGRQRTPARRPPRRPGKPTPALAKRILDLLETAHPEARCALDYASPFQLLVATILSAQCTDKRVNEVTPALFRRYPTPLALLGAAPAELEEAIRPTGFFRSKARSIQGCARALVEGHGGVVPRSLEALVELPGVGRKTASVVLGHAYGVAEGIAVDTHVLRVSDRLGLARAADGPAQVEAALMRLVPRSRWTRTTDLLIFHGRKLCDARRPRCGACPLFGLCRFQGRQAFALAGGPASRPGPARGYRRPRK